MKDLQGKIYFQIKNDTIQANKKSEQVMYSENSYECEPTDLSLSVGPIQ